MGNVLEYFKYSSTSLNPSIESCDISSCLNGVKRLLSSEIDNKKLDVRVLVSKKTALNVDRRSLEQVFFNILENAVEASKQYDVIQVTASELTTKNMNLLVV